MIEILNKLINIVVGTSDIQFILGMNALEDSYYNYISEFYYEFLPSFDSGSVPIEPFKAMFSWFFSTPQAIISFVFYIMVSFGIIYFFLVVPFRLIKQLLPRSVRTKKGANKA